MLSPELQCLSGSGGAGDTGRADGSHPTNPGWRPLTPDEQLEEVKRIKDRTRKMAREGMFGGPR